MLVVFLKPLKEELIGKKYQKPVYVTVSSGSHLSGENT